MNRIADRINKLSFSRKLAFTFFVCSLLTFLVIDIIMNVLYSTIVATANTDSTFNTQAFSQFSNNQIESSTQAYMRGGVDLYEQIVTQIYTTYLHFENSSHLYTSNQAKGVNPMEQWNYNDTAYYDRTCMYFYTPNSTFYDQPYIDKVMASSASQNYPNGLKRVNVIYQSKTNPDDISVRTLPATNDFYIPDSAVVSKKIAESYPGVIIFADWYYDQLSRKSNTSKLVTLRLLVPNDKDYNMLIQIQVFKAVLDTVMNNVYSFPNTKIYLIKLLAEGWSILGQNAPIPDGVSLTNYMDIGSRNITMEDAQFLVTTMLVEGDNTQFPDQYNNRDNYIYPLVDMKIVIFLNTSQTRLPNTVYDQFRKNEYEALVFLLYGWTFIVMLVVFSIGVVIGDIIFSYFKLIGQKCKQYRQKPEQIKQIQKQIKSRSDLTSTKNQLLIENIVSIMQGIQHKKQQNKKNYKINYDMYPLNRLGMSFQSRMRLRDYNKFQSIAQLIKERPRVNL